MPTDKLCTKILILLEKKGIVRFYEIVKMLWEDPENSKLSQDVPSFRVLVFKRLKRLMKNDLVDKHRKSHKNVSYFLTRQGREHIRRLYLEKLIYSLPPVEVQVLQTLVFFSISYTHIMAPLGATLEDYIKILKEHINRPDFIDKAKSLIDDPKKVYVQFSKHISEYQAQKLMTLKEPR